MYRYGDCSIYKKIMGVIHTELSQAVLKEFAKVMISEKEAKHNSFVYGTAHKNGNNVYVKFDGSTLYTPVSNVVDVDDGNRVLVLVKNHSGTILSNVSSPAVSNSNFSNFKDQTSQEFTRIQANIGEFNLVFTDRLVANEAEIGSLKATVGEFKELTTEQLTAINAKIENADITYAKIDLTNIEKGSIQQYMLGDGVIGTTQIADGSITDAKIVELTANKITAGTLSVERLEIRGSTSSIVYGLNNITGALQAQNVNTLNGEILTPRSITADRIVASSITSGELNVQEIFANSAIITTIFAQDITATGTIRGMNLVGVTGSFSGSITASSGTIGGFRINASSIDTTNSYGNVVTIANGSNANQDVLVIRTGAGTTASPYKWPAFIRANGYAQFDNAKIIGDITANSLTALNTYYIHNASGVRAIAMTAPDGSFGSSLNVGSGFTSLYLKGLIVNVGNVYCGEDSSWGFNCGKLTVATGHAGSWIQSFNGGSAVLYLSNPGTSTGFSCMTTIKTTNGAWATGAYNHDNAFYIIYGSNSRISSGENGYDTGFSFGADGGLRVPGYLRCKNLAGSVDQYVCCSYGTNGRRVAFVASRGSGNTYKVNFNGQYSDNASSTAYKSLGVTVSSSDIRLKKNIKDTEVEALPVINQIKMRQFDWIETDSHQELGFVADELELINPNFASGGGYDEDGSMDVKIVNEFYLLGYLTKAIQEICQSMAREERKKETYRDGFEWKLSQILERVADQEIKIASQEKQIKELLNALQAKA